MLTVAVKCANGSFTRASATGSKWDEAERDTGGPLVGQVHDYPNIRLYAVCSRPSWGSTLAKKNAATSVLAIRRNSPTQ
jgi:hypothetical protein